MFPSVLFVNMTKSTKKPILNMSKLLSRAYNFLDRITVGNVENKAGYTATQATCGWAGAVIKNTNQAVRQE